MIDWAKSSELFGSNELKQNQKMKVVVTCHLCNEEHHRTLERVRASYKKYGDGNFRCLKCTMNLPESKERCSKNGKKVWEEKGEQLIATFQSDEYRESQKQKAIEKWQDPEYIAKQMSPEAVERRKEQSSEVVTKLWENPEIREKYIKALSERSK